MKKLEDINTIEIVNQYDEKEGKIIGICNPLGNSFDSGDFLSINMPLHVKGLDSEHVVAIANRKAFYETNNNLKALRFDSCDVYSKSDASFKKDSDGYAPLIVNKFGLYKIMIKVNWKKENKHYCGIAVNDEISNKIERLSETNGKSQAFTTIIKLNMLDKLKLVVASEQKDVMEEAIMFVEKVA